ncbi:MAG: hypothetical protein H7321_09325 [Bacteroidia bacterium]|nr:hypothetical protein [Bacteroidia bacterium]
MNYILLELMPVASVLGIVTVAALGIISFAYKKLLEINEKKIENLDEEIKALKLEIRKIEKSITDLNLNIVKQLNEITVKVYEYRK